MEEVPFVAKDFNNRYAGAVPFLRNFHWGGGGAKQEKMQNEKYEPSRFG
jgi:hypothetical protein